MHIIHIFDVLFLAPVPIGSILKYSSRVVFAKDKIIIVPVVLMTQKFNNGDDVVTTEVHIALESDEKIVKEVVPSTYEEGIAYLHGNRLY